MKKLNLGNINAGLSTIKELANENAGIARDELIDVSLIDFANKNTYAANDTDDSIRDLADQIETVGLLNPLGVIQSGNRYKLFSGERRYRAITQYLHWDKIPCRIFEGVSAGRAQLMLHIANGGRDYTAEQKLTLYEEYRELLNELKASGEFKGGIQRVSPN
ncbi:MAG: ParB/RepB/Spo0J family partition protein [Hominenteromicrobium sp.]|uniref:ParB/RepB/Spo0J family partition protein n=1 Tax=Hominenteromicrobium sp. TaxID=3073581 RepID=UPI0039941E53